VAEWAAGIETMSTIKERLSICANLLQEIERHRSRTHDSGRGVGIEHCIIDRELRELERDILEDPGDLESQLVRIRRRRAVR
jgi:hypothetical protein